jgi:hypothetical protein
MRATRFHLAIDERGSCHGFSSEGPELLHARSPSHCIVEIQLPLPPRSGSALVGVTEHPLTDTAGTTTPASAWFALDDDGGCVAYAGSQSGLAEVRRAADRYAEGSGLGVAVVRVDVPLPPGSASARVTMA